MLKPTRRAVCGWLSTRAVTVLGLLGIGVAAGKHTFVSCALLVIGCVAVMELLYKLHATQAAWARLAVLGTIYMSICVVYTLYEIHTVLASEQARWIDTDTNICSIPAKRKLYTNDPDTENFCLTNDKNMKRSAVNHYWIRIGNLLPLKLFTRYSFKEAMESVVGTNPFALMSLGAATSTLGMAYVTPATFGAFFAWLAAWAMRKAEAIPK